MRSIYISISADAADRLRDLAWRERRSPRQQAAVLVLAGLKNAGLNPDESGKYPVDPPDVSLGSSELTSGAGVRAGQAAHGSDDLPVGE